MSSLNKVTLIGNVGKDPEIRSTQTGMRIANLSLATSEVWNDKASGERKERTEWHRISVFNDGLVGVIEKWVKKGGKIYIEGSLQTRKWTDQQGIDRYSTEIVLGQFNGKLILLGGPNDAERSGGAPSSSYSGRTAAPAGSMSDRAGAGHTHTPPGGDLDDEIPF